jgi:hypothetical protein
MNLSSLNTLLFVDPPELSDQTASEILDFLYQLSTAFENHYADQLRRYYQSLETDPSQQQNLFDNGNQESEQSPQDIVEGFDDQLPPF